MVRSVTKSYTEDDRRTTLIAVKKQNGKQKLDSQSG